MKNLVFTETLEAPQAITSNILEYNGSIFVACGNKMFRKRSDSEKFEQMIFVNAQTAD